MVVANDSDVSDVTDDIRLTGALTQSGSARCGSRSRQRRSLSDWAWFSEGSWVDGVPPNEFEVKANDGIDLGYVHEAADWTQA